MISCLALTGCFDNKDKPQDIPTVTSLEELSKTNRAEIVRLYLRGSSVPVKDADLTDLPSLKVLDLSELKLKTVPTQVFNLGTLEQLYLAYNELTALPPETEKLASLQYLNLDGNKIPVLGDDVAKLTELRWLRLNNNRLSSLPMSFNGLKKLQRIYLKGNRFKSVPECLKGLPLLEDISLDSNPEVKEIPAWVAELPSLCNLSFSGCGISKMPENLEGFRKLKSLQLSGCPIPPEEMARIRSVLTKVAIVF